MPVGGGFEGNRELTLSGVGGRGCSTTALIMYRHGRSLDFAGEGGTGEGGGGRGGGNTPSLQDRNTWLRIAVMA